MAEDVDGAGGGTLADVGPVGVADALADRDEDGAVFLKLGLDVGDKGVVGEGALGEVDKLGLIAAVEAGAGGGGGKPAGVAAHDLDDGDGGNVVDGDVAGKLGEGCGDVLGGGAEAGGMVGAAEVVVDGFRRAHDGDVKPLLAHELRELGDGIHRIVSADVDEIADIKLPEDLDNLLELGAVLFEGLELQAAGAESRAGGTDEPLHGLGGAELRAEVDEASVEDALDAVDARIDRTDAVGQHRLCDGSGDGSVDGGGRAAGLCDQKVSFHGNLRL